MLNIALFVVLFILYYITGFSLGYGSNDKYETNSLWLYLGFILFHFFINFLFIIKPKMTLARHIIISSIMILLLYGILAYIYR